MFQQTETDNLKTIYTDNPTAFNFTIGNAGYTPALIYFSQWTLAPGAYMSATVINEKHPLNNCS